MRSDPGGACDADASRHVRLPARFTRAIHRVSEPLYVPSAANELLDRSRAQSVPASRELRGDESRTRGGHLATQAPLQTQSRERSHASGSMRSDAKRMPCSTRCVFGDTIEFFTFVGCGVRSGTQPETKLSVHLDSE